MVITTAEIEKRKCDLPRGGRRSQAIDMAVSGKYTSMAQIASEMGVTRQYVEQCLIVGGVGGIEWKTIKHKALSALKDAAATDRRFRIPSDPLARKVFLSAQSHGLEPEFPRPIDRVMEINGHSLRVYPGQAWRCEHSRFDEGWMSRINAMYEFNVICFGDRIFVAPSAVLLNQWPGGRAYYIISRNNIWGARFDWEPYREAWHLLEEPYHGPDPR